MISATNFSLFLSLSCSVSRTETPLQTGRTFCSMLYDQFFSTAIARLHEERCYRVFAELERSAGRLPDATWRSP